MISPQHSRRINTLHRLLAIYGWKGAQCASAYHLAKYHFSRNGWILTHSLIPGMVSCLEAAYFADRAYPKHRGTIVVTKTFIPDRMYVRDLRCFLRKLDTEIHKWETRHLRVVKVQKKGLESLLK